MEEALQKTSQVDLVSNMQQLKASFIKEGGKIESQFLFEQKNAVLKPRAVYEKMCNFILN